MKGACALLAAALLVVSALPAAAGDAKSIPGGDASRHLRFKQPHPKIIGGGDASDRHPFNHDRFKRPHTQIIFVVPSYPRWVPGYWTYQWVPQVYTQYVWVPGYYDPNGYWVEGQYVPQAIETGYYRPYWVSGYWRDP